MSTSAQAPQVWDYQDPREFVRDLGDWKKDHEKNFSFRRLCRQAGFGSPSYVKAYLDNRRNLRGNSALRLGQALGLEDAALDYFGKLVAHDQAGDPAKRQELRLDLLRLAIRHGHTAPIDNARLDYFAHWFVPVVHAMASLQGFRADPHWIAARVRPKIRSYDAKLALDTLAELGLLTSSDGKLQVAERRVAVQPELQTTLVSEYLRQMRQLVEERPGQQTPGARINSGMTVTVPEPMYAEVRQRVEKFREELYATIMAAQAGQTDVKGQVVHVGFQVFKVTDVEADAPL